MENRFETRSHPEKNVLSVCATWLFMALLSFGALRVTVNLFIFLESILFLTCGIMALFVSRVYWLLKFVDDTLYLENSLTHKSFRIYDVPASDFVIRQSKKQLAKDRCDIKIKDTVFAIYDADCASELQKYISENFK